MSYERQDSTSKVQLYRERKVERMAAMRRAIDQGRTTVVSTDSASSDEAPSNVSYYLCSPQVAAEIRSLPDWIIPTAFKGISARISEKVESLIRSSYTDMQSTNASEFRAKLEELNSRINPHHYIDALGHPNKAACLISEVLHDKKSPTYKIPKYRLVNHDNKVFIFIGEEPEAQSDYIGIESGGQWIDSIQMFDLNNQYVRTSSSLASENNIKADKYRYQERVYTHKK